MGWFLTSTDWSTHWNFFFFLKEDWVLKMLAEFLTFMEVIFTLQGICAFSFYFLLGFRLWASTESPSIFVLSGRDPVRPGKVKVQAEPKDNSHHMLMTSKQIAVFCKPVTSICIDFLHFWLFNQPLYLLLHFSLKAVLLMYISNARKIGVAQIYVS